MYPTDTFLLLPLIALMPYLAPLGGAEMARNRAYDPELWQCVQTRVLLLVATLPWQRQPYPEVRTRTHVS